MENSRIIVGDVHGCLKTLKALIEQLPHDNLCFVGDLIDRGPDSMGVVDFVKDNDYDCVKGNHEDMMVRCDGKAVYHWTRNGGNTTLRNYAGHPEKLKEHLEWMKELPTGIVYESIKNDKDERLMVSHSMAWYAHRMIGRWTEEQIDESLMWERNFHKLKPIPGIYNVFGHTPQEFDPRVKSFYACIDTGAVYNREPFHKPNPYGVLSALEFPSMKVFQQKNLEDE